MANCLLCGSVASFSYDVSSDKVKRSLASIFKDSSIGGIDIPNYRMFTCGTCQLQFADPPVAGSNAFYNWIVGHANYYPNERWEWGIVRGRLEALASGRPEPLTVVDVGSGTGDFLAVLAGIPNVRGIGIDITAQSVKTCRERGYEAYCADFKNAKDCITGSIDVITAFHSLEHVADPLGFVTQARDLAGPAGVLMISTPYSPMSFEGGWFDPLNHPPHHITRWNELSYQVLAGRTGMNLTIVPGPVNGVVRRTLQAFSLQMDLGAIGAPTAQHTAIVAAAMRHPLDFMTEVLRQVRRRRLLNKHAPDVILVELHKGDASKGSDRMQLG